MQPICEVRWNGNETAHASVEKDGRASLDVATVLKLRLFLWLC